jgi:hypothetical protein
VRPAVIGNLDRVSIALRHFAAQRYVEFRGVARICERTVRVSDGIDTEQAVEIQLQQCHLTRRQKCNFRGSRNRSGFNLYVVAQGIVLHLVALQPL